MKRLYAQAGPGSAVPPDFYGPSYIGADLPIPCYRDRSSHDEMCYVVARLQAGSTNLRLELLS